MDGKQLLLELDSVLDTKRTGVLSTIDEKGFPQMRWMTPGIIPGQEGRIYCLANPDSLKVNQLEHNSQVGWMFNSGNMDRVISLKGRGKILQNPDLAGTVMEALGGNLANFWKLNHDPSHLLIIETIIEEIELYRPADGTRFRASV